MFKNYWSGVPARRFGRLTFGLVLLGAVVVLVERARGGALDHAALWLAGIWAAALVGGTAARAVAAVWRVPTIGAVPALVVPAVGVALLAPITIQAPFVFVLGTVHSFDWWITVAMTWMAPTHLVFAALVAARARGLVRGRWTPTPRWIFGATVMASAIPFAAFFLIPPALVALTGLPILPLLHHMKAVAARDAELLPVAIARPRATLLAA